MDTRRIGILIPYSSIYPIGKRFKTGLQEFLDQNSNYEFELIPEYTGQAQPRKVIEAINKLKYFHETDEICGLVSNMVLERMADKLNKGNPVIANNLGEHVYRPDHMPANLHLNSVHMWQQMWALGYWAVQNFGKKGLLAGGVYDIGYCFAQMLNLGMKASDGESELKYAFCPDPGFGQYSNPEYLMPLIEEEKPDFLFAAFCGKEASLFLDAFIKKNLHKDIPLIASPYLLEDFAENELKPLKIYTPISAYKTLITKNLEEDWTHPSGIFEQMGRESGALILEKLNQVELPQKRGKISFTTSESIQKNRVFLIENTHSGNKQSIKRKLLSELKTLPLNNETLTEALPKQISGWQNLYLGI